MHSHHSSPIEALESRIAPAGVVTIGYDSKSGILALVGDAVDNDVSVVRTGKDSYRIEGANGTVLDPGALTMVDIGKIQSLTFTGDDGADSLTLIGLNTLATLTVNGDAGADSVVLENTVVKGAATFGFGADGGTLAMGRDNVFGGDVTVNYGDGGGLVSANGDSLLVKGGFILNGGAGGDDFVLGATVAKVGKGIAFTAGNGSNSIEIDSVAALIGKSKTGQAVLFGGGIGGDSLDIMGAVVAFKGAIEFNGAGGNNSVTVMTSKAEVGGDLKITGGANADMLDWQSANGVVKGAVILELGDGDNSASFSGASLALGKTLSYTGGAGIDSLTLGSLGGPDTIVVKGQTTVTQGDGDNSVMFGGAVLTLGGLQVTGGLDGDTFDMSSTLATIKGTLGVDHGAGFNFFSIAGSSTSVGGELRVTSGDDGTIIQVEPGKLAVSKDVTVTTGAGDDVLNFVGNYVAFKKGLTIETGDGGDSVSLSSDGTVKGNAIIDLGTAAAGSAQFLDVKSLSGLAGNLVFGGNLALSSTTAGGVGSLDALVVSEVTVSKAMLITMGDGDGTLDINNLFANNVLTIGTGGGADVVNIEQDALFGPSVFRKTVNIDLGAGDDTFRAGVSNVVGGSSFIRFLGALTVDGGADTDASNDFLNPATNFFAPGVATNRVNFEGPFI